MTHLKVILYCYFTFYRKIASTNVAYLPNTCCCTMCQDLTSAGTDIIATCLHHVVTPYCKKLS